MRFARLPDQHPQIPKPPVRGFQHGLDVQRVLWAAGKPERFTFTAMPKGIGFRVKESSADGLGGGIVFPDVFKHGGMLDVSREGDSVLATLP